MTGAPGVATRTALLRQAAWRHPEAGAAAVAALAWVALVLPLAGPAPIRALHDDAHHAVPLLAAAAGWTLMSVAMMVPAALPAARAHGLGAVWSRRGRTVGLFLAGYLAVWLAFGAAAGAAVAGLDALLEPGRGVLLAAAALAAAAWEVAPAKWRAVRACHQLDPLPPRGRTADAVCVRAGVEHGRRCATSCWALMLAMVVAGHAAFGLMVVLTAIVLAERRAARPARLALPIAAVLAGEAVVALAL